MKMRLLKMLFLTVLSLVTKCQSFSLRHIIDRIDSLETKFETENRLRRSETGELFRKYSELTSAGTPEVDGEMKTNLHGSEINGTFDGTQIAKTNMEQVREYLVKGTAEEKRENIKARSKLVELADNLKNEFTVLESHIENKVTNLTSEIMDRHNSLVSQNAFNNLKSNVSEIKYSFEKIADELKGELHSIKSDIETSINGSIQEIKFEFHNMLEVLTSDVKTSITEQSKNMSTEINSTALFLLRELMKSVSCKKSTRNGLKIIYPYFQQNGIQVYCDQTIDGGGWIVFQRRQDGSVDFERTWADYKTGFGNLEGEFWIGKENLHALTSAGFNELRIDMEDFEGNRRYAKYNNFNVKSESENYAIDVSGYSGDAGDSLAYHNNMPFSTKDRDNDMISDSCSVTYKGAWWYNACHYSNLNGYYYRDSKSPDQAGIIWHDWKRPYYSLKRVEIKLR